MAVDERYGHTCFLFNLTQNLRFKSKGSGPFQIIDTSDHNRNKILRFGKDGALTIENDFKKVTSKIGDDKDSNPQFVFGDDLVQKLENKVDSIIPGNKYDIENPTMVEVWKFKLLK